MDKPISLPHGNPCGEVIHVCPSDDAWRYRGLGKSAAQVWALLRDRPGLTTKEMATTTGRNVKTVNRAISRMARIVDTNTGEVLALVEPDGDGWRAIEADLDAIARAVGTAGAGERQRTKHRREQEVWRARIAAERGVENGATT